MRFYIERGWSTLSLLAYYAVVATAAALVGMCCETILRWPRPAVVLACVFVMAGGVAARHSKARLTN